MKMKIEYNLNKIDEFSPNEWIVMVLIATNGFTQMETLLSKRRREISDTINKLIHKGLVVNTSKEANYRAMSLVPTKEGKSSVGKKILLSKLTSKREIESWIDEWRDNFPKGKHSSGLPFKGSRANCITKMYNFIKNYGYDKESIYIATKAYLESFKGDYYYAKTAQNFIQKDRESVLAAYCELIEENGEVEASAETNVINL